ncbi:MAG: restriction endonuclease, partial [Sphingobacteriia bacterium]
PVDLGHWKRGTDLYLPLYEGKSIHHYNHRNAAIKVNPENLHNQALAVHSTAAQLAQPHYHPRPQYYIPASAHPLLAQHRYFLGFRDIARATDERTVLATLIPRAGVGNTLPILLPEDELDPVYLLCFSANFSSFVFDFVARQKMQSTHLSYYVLEQLPVIPPETYEQPLGSTTVGAWVQQQVLRLCYTAWDLQPLAQDLGYTGPPYAWDQEDRTHRMARLDALYFLLYGLAEDEVRYVLGTFPIVRRKDLEHHGHYRTERLILAYMRALRAGDTEVVVRG